MIAEDDAGDPATTSEQPSPGNQAPEAEKPAGAATENAAAPAQKAAAPADKPSTPADKPDEDDEQPVATPDPETCKAIAISMDELLSSVLAGEWDDTDFEYYLEPAGVLQATLRCSRSPENEQQRAGLLMTRAAWQARTLFLDDGLNPETYELSFPKEFGYVKPLSHYKPESRQHALFPWSKKY
jgi:hypothetical protein